MAISARRLHLHLFRALLIQVWSSIRVKKTRIARAFSSVCDPDRVLARADDRNLLAARDGRVDRTVGQSARPPLLAFPRPRPRPHHPVHRTVRRPFL